MSCAGILSDVENDSLSPPLQCQPSLKEVKECEMNPECLVFLNLDLSSDLAQTSQKISSESTVQTKEVLPHQILTKICVYILYKYLIMI